MMKKAGVLCLLLIVLTGCIPESLSDIVGPTDAPPTPPELPPKPQPGIELSNDTAGTITIANWNLQIFGQTKASKDWLMDFYADKIDDYDIVFVQEIRDKEGTAFPRLCSLLPGYQCMNSSRAGRSTSKEQVGIIYRDGIEVKEFVDRNPDKIDRWERPPVEVLFSVDGYEFRVYNIHVKPDDVRQELAALEDVMPTLGNQLVIGDLNADCSYYDRETEFDSWHWIVKDEDDTTVADSSCAYDRIIFNDDAFNEFLDYGIVSEGINKTVSDHYLVWVEISTRDD